MDALIDKVTRGNVDFRRAVAEALPRLDGPKWAEWVNGNDDDLARPGTAGDKRVVSPLITSLSSHGNRHAEARALISIARDNPAFLRRAQWRDVGTTVSTAHSDSHDDGSHYSDCHVDSHHDMGIGLPFPSLPDDLPPNSTDEHDGERPVSTDF